MGHFVALYWDRLQLLKDIWGCHTVSQTNFFSFSTSYSPTQSVVTRFLSLDTCQMFNDDDKLFWDNQEMVNEKFFLLSSQRSRGNSQIFLIEDFYFEAIISKIQKIWWKFVKIKICSKIKIKNFEETKILLKAENSQESFKNISHKRKNFTQKQKFLPKTEFYQKN